MFLVASMSDFSVLAGILSGLDECPLLICLVAILISSVVGEVTSIKRFVCSASVFGEFNEAGLFKGSLMYSAHLFLCFCTSVTVFPSLSLTGLPGLLYFPTSSFLFHISLSQLFPLSLLALSRTSACRL
ncbi:unnamed protein product [Schistosoma bovis]|nr:unnamed protein product [Schistosoma bovis]